MSTKVLVLNHDYTALTVCSAQKAFMLVFANKAETIEQYSSFFYRTVSNSFAIPSIIKLNNYVRARYKTVVLNRNNIFKRDHNQCLYCGSKHDLTLDHVLPRSKGGQYSWDNLATACRRCNARKGNHLPQEMDMKLKYKPFRPSFVTFLRDFSGNNDDSWNIYLGPRSN